MLVLGSILLAVAASFLLGRWLKPVLASAVGLSMGLAVLLLGVIIRSVTVP